jgi:hypothetical protein
MKVWCAVLSVAVVLSAGTAFAQGAGPIAGPTTNPGPRMTPGPMTSPSVVEERAKNLAQLYVDRYLNGFVIQRVLPFNGRDGVRYAVELKGPAGEDRTLQVGPRGNVKPVLSSGRQERMSRTQGTMAQRWADHGVRSRRDRAVSRWEQGPGSQWDQGIGSASPGSQGMAVPGPTQVTDEKARELAQGYADRYLKGFTVQRILPFNGHRGARYAVDLKDARGEARTLIVGPRGNVRPAA